MKKIAIIGAGLSGIILSNELSKNYHVSLIEIGKKGKINYPKISYQNKPLGQVKTFCHGVGGTTNLWHNGLIPLHPEDIFEKEFKEVLLDSLKYRDEAANYLYWKGKSFNDEHRKIVSKTYKMIKALKIDLDGIDCLFYPKKYLPLKPVKNIDVYSSVRTINFELEGNEIVGISIKQNSRERLKINIQGLIISAGTLGSPFIVSKLYNQLGVFSDNIGRGYADHPMGFVGKVKIKKKYNEIFKKLSLTDFGSYISKTAFRLKSDCGKYTSAVFIRPAFSMENDLKLYKYKSGLGASRGLRRLKYFFSLKLFSRDVISEIISHLFKIPIPGRIYNIMLINDQKRGDNKVGYCKNTIKLNWSITSKEISIYNNMLKKLRTALLPLTDEININTTITPEWLWSGAHHSGSISLGSTSENLIDNNLRLKETKNVYVCDGSIIQEHSYANTGLTIAQFALRLANFLQSKIE